MTVTLVEQLAIVGGFVLVAVMAAGIGVVRVGIAALALKKRSDRLKELPILGTIASTRLRFARTTANLEDATRYLARAQAAVAEIVAARDRVVAVGRTIAVVGRTALSIASGVSQLADPRGASRRRG